LSGSSAWISNSIGTEVVAANLGESGRVTDERP
jgi:hypothetical protein